jgi:hypothetical protein
MLSSYGSVGASRAAAQQGRELKHDPNVIRPL